MEPVRTKLCVVLAMVFALTGCTMLGCGNRPDAKPAGADKTPPQVAEPEKSQAEPQEKPRKKPAEEPAELPVLDPPKVEIKEPPKVETDKISTPPLEKTAEEPKTDVPAPQSEGDKEDLADIDRPETREETARRLGPPLVDAPEKLKRLDPVDAIWLDKPAGQLIMVGEVCQRSAPLEMFVCLWHTKEHESVLVTRVPAYAAHAGLLALGAKPGRSVQFMPKYIPAEGTEVDIEVIWKDKDGNIQKRDGRDWIRNFQTKKSLDLPWVFAGSGFWTDETTGKKHYQAESGDFICVSNFSTAMLDLPIESSQQNDALMFEAFAERIPPLGTPVTIVLKPHLEKPADKKTVN